MKPIKAFYQLSLAERQQLLSEMYGVTNMTASLNTTVANAMVENYFSNYELPMGIATNFSINGQCLHIPMVTEEPSVIAAASNGAKRVGNIITTIDERELIGQIVFDCHDYPESAQILETAKDYLFQEAQRLSKRMIERGGGPTRIWLNSFDDFVTLYIGYNPCEAMGANAINTLLEALSALIEAQYHIVAFMKILSNYQPESLAKARVAINIDMLASDSVMAHKIATKIAQASRYAHQDVYRAVTHNKGIMNGVDAVLIATGNDWRAVNASVHAFASRLGQYQPLTKWWIEQEQLIGEISLPLLVATVGGTLAVHSQAQLSLKMLNNPTADELAQIIASVGLAQNFSALRAIVTDGIQKGHMGLHARQLALQVGAVGDEVEKVVTLLKKAPAISQSVAQEILEKLRHNN